MDSKDSVDFFVTLVKTLQSLCNGYVKFINQVHVTGHLVVSVDAEETIEYVVNEKLRKASSGIVDIVSNSFHAQKLPESNLVTVDVKDEIVDNEYSEVMNNVDQLIDVQSNTSGLPLDKSGDLVKGISKIQSTGISDQQNNEQTSCTTDINEVSSNCSHTEEAGLEAVSDGEVEMFDIKGCMNSQAATNVKDCGPQITIIYNGDNDNTLMESELKKGKRFSVLSGL